MEGNHNCSRDQISDPGWIHLIGCGRERRVSRKLNHFLPYPLPQPLNEHQTLLKASELKMSFLPKKFPAPVGKINARPLAIEQDIANPSNSQADVPIPRGLYAFPPIDA
jgi:hypothetical protein